ncbi:MAG: hypothetical protein GKS00_13435 [Alphaproteobacteria bacterium]|nr:hypothetical protein [Alphaproteobacteria bacterium]
MSEKSSVLIDLILNEPWRRNVLEAVAALHLNDCWIGAGFLRTPLWDLLHNYQTPTPIADIDVIYFNSTNVETDTELELERRLAQSGPDLPWPETYWSVRNQARMHLLNGDPPYSDTSDAIAHWPETPTAVAIRLNEAGTPELLAPFGLDDLFALTVRPTPHAKAHKMPVFRERVSRKNWQTKWPKLTVVL